MHLVTARNHQLVQQIAAWLEDLELPPEWAVPMVQDFERGEALKLARAVEDQIAVSRSNAAAAHHSVDGLGQVEMQMASRLRIEIARRYKDKHVLQDKKYLKKLEAEHGFQLQPAYRGKTRITVNKSFNRQAS